MWVVIDQRYAAALRFRDAPPRRKPFFREASWSPSPIRAGDARVGRIASRKCAIWPSRWASLKFTRNKVRNRNSRSFAPKLPRPKPSNVGDGINDARP